MKIMVYGFGPYCEFRDNITEKIIRALPKISGVETHVFEVSFDREMFLRTFRETDPDVILGLGQHPLARKIRVERRARDARSDRNGKPIEGTGSRRMSLTLPKHKLSTTTYDAGDYVCNFSMWAAEEYARSTGKRAAFLHLPRRLEVSVGVEYLTWLLAELRGERGGL
jgi:pyrrolidone-carboxylate peptidase